jgi:hypothetical protein
MTGSEKFDVGLFILTTLFCGIAFMRAGQYPSDLARRVRLRAAGIAIWMSVLPLGVFLIDAFSTVVWTVLMASILVVGAFLFYGASRKN